MKNIFKCLLVLSLLTSIGCEDFLEREPMDITYSEVYWQNQAEAEQSLAGAYGLLKEAVTAKANFIYWGELAGRTFVKQENWICSALQENGNYVLDYRETTRDWRKLFRAANWSLTIESYVDEMDDDLFTSKEEKNRIIGEAAFIRSLAYFYMARLWGKVPIVTEIYEQTDQLINDDDYVVTIPQSSELEVLDHALKAVNKSIGLLNYGKPGDELWAITANKGSAEALKAHISLWYASRDNDNETMIQDCIDAATSVIQNSNTYLIDYTEPDSLTRVAEMCMGQSETSLFEINFNADMQESVLMSNKDDIHVGLMNQQPVFKDWVNSWVRIDSEYYGKEFMAQDESRKDDVRKNVFFHNYDHWEESFCTKYKYTSQDANSKDPWAQFSESNILIFRLADIYLLRAEAYAKKGSSGLATEDLNLIRSKAAVPDYEGSTDRESLIEAIFQERSIELVGEGHAAFDRIRMDYYYNGVPWMSPTRIQRKGYFWPIDPSIIRANPEVLQTEWWQGKTNV